MKKEKKYKINFKGFGNGVHDFSFEIDKSFFNDSKDQDIEDVNLIAEVIMNKSERQLFFNIKIDGTLTLTCDRCLDLYKQDINFNEKMIVKFGEKYVEEESNIYIIPTDSDEVDLTQYFYESIVLSIPYKRIHTKEEEVSRCEKEMKILLEKQNGGNTIDPRWENLKILLTNKY